MKYTHRQTCDKLATYLYIIVSNHSVVAGVCVCVWWLILQHRTWI